MISRRWLLLDVAAAVAVTAAYASFASFDGADGSPAFGGPAGLGWLVAAAVGLPLAVRRWWPLAAAAVVAAGCAASALLDITREPFLPAALALYSVGALEPPRRSVPALAAVLAILTGGLYAGTHVWTPSESLGGTLLLIGLVWLIAGGGWAFGVATRRRRAAAERAAASERGRAAAEERLRIARELHDIVSHNLSLIAVQAGVGGHVAAEQPAQARAALQSIETISRRALSEMRDVLGVLRTESGERGPVPGLDGLAALAENARAAGVPVELTVGVGGPLPAGIELAVHRIVQEALTNVVKHAAPARCTVRVTADDREVVVDVQDDGHRPPSPGTGHGLAGCRERVALYAGGFRAGPRPGHGFAVYATIPYAGSAGR